MAIRNFSRVSICCVLTFAGWLMAVPAGHALSVDLICTASFPIEFNPPLDFNTVSAPSTASIEHCVSPNGSRPGLTAASAADTGQATGCAPAPLYMSGAGSLIWNDDSVSDYTYVISTDPVKGDLGKTAKITDGPMTGDTISAAPLVITQDGFCKLGGVRRLTAEASVITFTH